MAIDFRLLNTPEARELAERNRKQLEEKFAEQERIQLEMINHLRNREDELSSWELGFVNSVSSKVGLFTLTDKQQATLNSLFYKHKGEFNQWNKPKA